MKKNSVAIFVTSVLVAGALSGCGTSGSLKEWDRVTNRDGSADAILAVQSGWAGNVGVFSVFVVPHGGQVPQQNDNSLVLQGSGWVDANGVLGASIHFDAGDALAIVAKQGSVSYQQSSVMIPSHGSIRVNVTR